MLIVCLLVLFVCGLCLIGLLSVLVCLFDWLIFFVLFACVLACFVWPFFCFVCLFVFGVRVCFLCVAFFLFLVLACLMLRFVVCLFGWLLIGFACQFVLIVCVRACLLVSLFVRRCARLYVCLCLVVLFCLLLLFRCFACLFV